MHQKIFCLYLILVGCIALPAKSETAYDISFETGRARFFGNLSNDQNAPTNAVSTRITQRQEFSQWGLGIHILQATTDHSGAAFPFDSKSRLNLLSFFFTPVWCSRGSLYVCAALGNGSVNVNSRRNRQDYGTWTYHTNLAIKLHESWALSLGAKYAGRVEQQIQEKKTYFSFLSILLGITYGTSHQ